jgi:hypothetical protein
MRWFGRWRGRSWPVARSATQLEFGSCLTAKNTVRQGRSRNRGIREIRGRETHSIPFSAYSAVYLFPEYSSQPAHEFHYCTAKNANNPEKKESFSSQADNQAITRRVSRNPGEMSRIPLSLCSLRCDRPSCSQPANERNRGIRRIRGKRNGVCPPFRVFRPFRG